MIRIRSQRIFTLLTLLAIVLCAKVFLDLRTVKFSFNDEQGARMRMRTSGSTSKSSPERSERRNGEKNIPKAVVTKKMEKKKDTWNHLLKENIEKQANMTSKKAGLHSAVIHNYSSDYSPENYKVDKTSSKYELSSTTNELVVGKSQATIENIDVRRGFSGGLNYCDLPFKYGQMCPQSYTELGGFCRISKSGFDCPDIRSKADNPHRQCQLITTRMLRIFDLVCKKHNISYWLSGGTLLGAARHRGNIPWDTDNDIEMPLQDYITFFQTASKELPENIFFQNSLSDPALRPSNPEVAASLTHRIVGIYKSTWNPRLRDTKSCYKYCIKNGCSWHDGMMIDIFVQENYPGVFPLKQMEFEGFLFPVPNNWQSRLQKSYGYDFMKVPEKEKDRKPVDFPDTEHSCDELRQAKP